MKAITRRIKQPSTWAGLATICLSLAPAIPAVAVPLTAAAGVFGGLAMILNEKAAQPKPNQDGQ